MEEARGPLSPRVVASQGGKGEHWTVSPAGQVVFPGSCLPSPVPRFPSPCNAGAPIGRRLDSERKTGQQPVEFPEGSALSREEVLAGALPCPRDQLRRRDVAFAVSTEQAAGDKPQR